ncbi:hypothetical protein BPXVP50A3_00195 [Buffalopox virus]|nr:hypothetical protein BPXVP50A3_00195 [Buffalopox virus]UJQ44734.1 hypothetical protein BPXVP50C5_00017 [Buffalopox virus]UXP71362.1 hypothetical protein [Buffalopox virus]UXP71565.1 hypothetical protein [Buffalopox virus]
MSFDKYDGIITKCHKETILLKLSTVLDTTLYAVLRCHNSRKLRRYLTELKKYNNDKSFKIYSNIMNKRYLNVYYKDMYVSKVYDKLFPVFTDKNCLLTLLPSEIIYKILYMLTINDLYNISYPPTKV